MKTDDIKCGPLIAKENILIYTVKAKTDFIGATPRTIQLKYPSNNLRSWHLDVIHTEKGYEMIVVASTNGHRHREMNLYYTSSKNEHDFKKCITILKPSEKKKSMGQPWYLPQQLLCRKMESIISITAVSDIQKDQTALRVLVLHMGHR